MSNNLIDYQVIPAPSGLWKVYKFEGNFFKSKIHFLIFARSEICEDNLKIMFLDSSDFNDSEGIWINDESYHIVGASNNKDIIGFIDESGLLKQISLKDEPNFYSFEHFSFETFLKEK
jgi:hypothetical protein